LGVVWVQFGGRGGGGVDRGASFVYEALGRFDRRGRPGLETKGNGRGRTAVYGVVLP